MKNLEACFDLNIRFSDTDAMGVVWHGNYLRFFEDAREAFGRKYHFSYLDIFNHGHFTPIVKSEIDYKSPLYYGEKATIRCSMIYTPAAKIVFEYEIFNHSTGKISATGLTVQVFLERQSRELTLNKPPFYTEWESKMKLGYNNA